MEEIKSKPLSSFMFFLLLPLIFIRPFFSGLAYPMLETYYENIVIFFAIISLLFYKKEPSKNPYTFPIVLLLFSYIVSSVHSFNIQNSIKETVKFISYISIFLIVSQTNDKQKNILIKTIVIAASIISLYSIYQYFWGYTHTLDYLKKINSGLLATSSYTRDILIGKRAIGTFPSPNILAGYLILSFFLAMYLRLTIPIVLIAAALILTKSMGAWLSLIFVLMILFIISYKSIKKRKLIVVLSLLFISFALSFILITRWERLINLKNPQNSITQRLNYWHTAMAVIKEHPFLGVGPGNFQEVFLKYKAGLSTDTRYAHNIFLHTWAETGLLGLISLIFFIAIFIKTVLKLEKNYLHIGLITSCSVFLINNLFDFSFFIPQVAFIWWTNLGLIAGSCSMSSNGYNRRIKFLIALLLIAVIYLDGKSILAQTYFQQGRYKKAVALEPYNDVYHAKLKDYHKAIQLNPYYPYYHRDLAVSYLSKNMIDEAISEFEKASALYPANEQFHQQLYDLYKKIGDEENAQKEEQKLKEFYSRYSGYFIR